MNSHPQDRAWLPRPVCPDSRLRRWLVDRGSLTARLIGACRSFRVEVLRQGLARATRDERTLIGAGSAERVVVRDVCLRCDGEPVVFAHSVVHRDALCGAWRMLAGLGARPLGATLFADPSIARGALRFRKLAGEHDLARRATAVTAVDQEPLWARRSLFVRCGVPLVVTEVFLPRILEFVP